MAKNMATLNTNIPFDTSDFKRDPDAEKAQIDWSYGIIWVKPQMK